LCYLSVIVSHCPSQSCESCRIPCYRVNVRAFPNKILCCFLLAQKCCKSDKREAVWRVGAHEWRVLIYERFGAVELSQGRGFKDIEFCFLDAYCLRDTCLAMVESKKYDRSAILCFAVCEVWVCF